MDMSFFLRNELSYTTQMRGKGQIKREAFS